MGTTSVGPVCTFIASGIKGLYMLEFYTRRSIFICVWCRCLVVLYVVHFVLLLYAHLFLKSILKSILIFYFIIFQLVKKPIHKNDEKSEPMYDDEYQTGGGSTVY
jgi:hypothetical protein